MQSNLKRFLSFCLFYRTIVTDTLEQEILYNYNRCWVAFLILSSLFLLSKPIALCKVGTLPVHLVSIVNLFRHVDLFIECESRRNIAFEHIKEYFGCSKCGWEEGWGKKHLSVAYILHCAKMALRKSRTSQWRLLLGAAYSKRWSE